MKPSGALRGHRDGLGREVDVADPQPCDTVAVVGEEAEVSPAEAARLLGVSRQ
ncbi:MAG: hypothetical protein ACYC1D_01035 [Acidimicrobiales bacterium]